MLSSPPPSLNSQSKVAQGSTCPGSPQAFPLSKNQGFPFPAHFCSVLPTDIRIPSLWGIRTHSPSLLWEPVLLDSEHIIVSSYSFLINFAFWSKSSLNSREPQTPFRGLVDYLYHSSSKFKTMCLDTRLTEADRLGVVPFLFKGKYKTRPGNPALDPRTPPGLSPYSKSRCH